MELNGSYNLSLINPEKDKQYVNAWGKGQDKPINRKRKWRKKTGKIGKKKREGKAEKTRIINEKKKGKQKGWMKAWMNE